MCCLAQPAVQPPGAAALAAAADVRVDEDDATVEQARQRRVPVRLEGVLVGAVAVDQRGRGAVERGVPVPDHGRADAECRRAPGSDGSRRRSARGRVRGLLAALGARRWRGRRPTRPGLDIGAVRTVTRPASYDVLRAMCTRARRGTGSRPRAGRPGRRGRGCRSRCSPPARALSTAPPSNASTRSIRSAGSSGRTSATSRRSGRRRGIGASISRNSTASSLVTSSSRPGAGVRRRARRGRPRRRGDRRSRGAPGRVVRVDRTRSPWCRGSRCG